MIVDVRLVDVGADDESVFAFGKTPGQLHAQAVGFFRRNLARNEGLPQVVSDHIVRTAHPASAGGVGLLIKKELGVGHAAVALVAGDEPAVVGLIGIFYIVDDVADRLADRAALASVQRHDAGGGHNGQKINPPLYLQPEACTVDGRTLLVIQVPSGSQVCRHHGRIFDRSHEADIDITDNSDMVYQLYARKSGSYFVNKVTRFQMDDLRPDLMERARAMTTSRTANHPWKSMSDEELLRSAGLILKDPERQLEGITLAAILLFGKDSTILSVLPQHKTDAIFRVENPDRYDDRDVIITNLLETYDRLIAFGQKHLSDPFVQEGLQSVSARDRILREIFSNSLAHRDYSSGYVAKFVIERNRLYTENANRSHGHGALHLSSFEPYAKNPPISKVFREIGLADEPGSGMRNTYKYTKLYSGGTPEFIEGDVFRTVVPLAPIAVEKVGPQDGNQVTTD